MAGELARFYFHFELRERESVSPEHEEKRDLVPQPPVQGRVGLRKRDGHVSPGETNNRRQFSPSLLLEANVGFLLNQPMLLRKAYKNVT
jgi:hypothetical protein